jgi:hypothetical protein
MFIKRKGLSSVGQEFDKLKTPFIAKAISVIVACTILAIFLVPTGFAYKVGVSGNGPTSTTPCNDKPSTFTIFPYARLKPNSDGSSVGVEVHFSSADGGCSTKIYSSHNVGYNNLAENHYDNNDSVIALR